MIQKILKKLNEIVVTDGCDKGVVWLDVHGTTHYDADAKCQVYDHEHFSPLGDALIELHDMILGLVPKWYSAAEVSREIFDGDIWWWNNGEQVFPVNIAWSPTTERFFATQNQWGWGRSQDLIEMGGRWTPCVEPEAEPGSQSF